MKKDISIPLVVLTALIVSATFPAYAASTDPEVMKARADCHSHKMKVIALEASSKENDPKLQEERAAWEHACVLASSMMDSKSDKHAAKTSGESPAPKTP